MPKKDHTNRNFLIYLAIILLLIWLLPANAAEKYAAMVINAKGSVTAIDPDQKSRNLTRRSHIYNKETVVAGKNSSAQIRFADGSLIAIQADSRFKIDDYQYKQPGKENKNSLTLIKGGFRNVSGAIGKENPDAVDFKTPTATIGLRGTDFDTYLDPAQAEELVRVHEGSIEFTVDDTDESKVLDAGEALVFDTETFALEDIAMDDPRFDELDVTLPSEDEIAQVLEEDQEDAAASDDDEEADADSEDEAADADTEDEAVDAGSDEESVDADGDNADYDDSSDNESFFD